jgi:hypothetical protein
MKSEQNLANIKQNFQVGIAKFSKNLLVFNRIKQIIMMKVYKLLQNVMKVYEIS